MTTALRLTLTVVLLVAFPLAFVAWEPIRTPLAVAGLIGYAITGFTLGMYAAHMKRQTGSIGRGLTALLVLRYPPAIIGTGCMNLLRNRLPWLATSYGASEWLRKVSINPVIATIMPGLMMVWIISLYYGGWEAWWRTVAIVAIGVGIAIAGLSIKVASDRYAARCLNNS